MRILPKFTPMSYFEILSPRWHDRKVLLKASKVSTHNKIVFTGKDGKSMGDLPYYVSGATVKKYPKESNGTIMCYAVDLDELEILELDKKDWRALV